MTHDHSSNCCGCLPKKYIFNDNEMEEKRSIWNRVGWEREAEEDEQGRPCLLLACYCRLPEGDGRRQAGRRRATAGWSRSAGRAVEREPPSRRAPSRGYSNEVGGLLLAGTLPCPCLRPAPAPGVPLPAPRRRPLMHLATCACRRSSLLPTGYRRCTPPAARNRPKSHAGSRLGWDAEQRLRAA